MQNNDNGWTTAKANVKEGYLYAAFTDRIWLKKVPLSEEEEHEMEMLRPLMLECRVFDTKQEYRMARSDIGKSFKTRVKSDLELKAKEYFDEFQYLDIDIPATISIRKNEIYKKMVRTTGGGRYELPLEEWENARIQIRNYVSYSENGRASVVDWRIVDLVPAGRLQRKLKESGV